MCRLAVSFMAVLLLLLSPLTALAEKYEIDAAHSSVGFKVRHLGISYVKGSFPEFTGSVEFDPKNMAASKTSADIKMASVDTNNAKRDKHLRNEDFFNVEKFPSMSFVSTKVTDVKADSFKVHGELDLHGVKKPVVIDVEFGGVAKDPWGNEKVAFTGTTKIDRKDFGITYNKLLETGGFVIGQEVHITLDIQASRKLS